MRKAKFYKVGCLLFFNLIFQSDAMIEGSLAESLHRMGYLFISLLALIPTPSNTFCRRQHMLPSSYSKLLLPDSACKGLSTKDELSSHFPLQVRKLSYRRHKIILPNKPLSKGLRSPFGPKRPAKLLKF